MIAPARAAAALGAALLLAACAAGGEGEDPCRVYRPQVAKRTYDGRAGAVLVHNASGRPVEVRIYHPDGTGGVELRRTVGAKRLLAVSGEDGARLTLGNDWGIAAGGSCVRTLGQAAAWSPGEFALTFTGDSLRPGLEPGP